MPDLNADRRDHLRPTLATDGVAALLINSVSNVRYLTGFSGDATALLLTPDRTLAISDGRYTLQLSQECPDVEVHIRPIGQPLMLGVAEVVARLGLRSLGFESAVLTVGEFEKLQGALKGVEFRGVQDRVEAFRMLKDATELAAIRSAIDQAENAFQRLRGSLRDIETEKDAADALEAELRRAGAAAASFPPIVAAGRRAALPHARPQAEIRLADADHLLIDWGASEPGGYKSDLTRVLATGKVTDRFATIYRAVLAAQGRAIAAIRPGVPAREIDAEARAAIEEAGFGSFFNHGTGHGIGLDIHEAPSLRRESEMPLAAGMVVTIEPGIYLPDWGGVRIEDDILVTPDGAEVLSRLDRSLESALLT
jgi:Xaa-Pro aminopeptidase